MALIGRWPAAGGNKRTAFGGVQKRLSGPAAKYSPEMSLQQGVEQRNCKLIRRFPIDAKLDLNLTELEMGPLRLSEDELKVTFTQPFQIV